MKRYFIFVLLSAFVFGMGSGIHAQVSSPRFSFNEGNGKKTHSLKERDYQTALNQEAKRTGKFSLFYIDLQLGYGATNPNYDVKSGVSGVSSESKGGIVTAAFITLTLFDMLNFTTGLDFTKKNFGITAPLDPDSLISTPQEISNSFINIPIMFNFGGQLSKDVGLQLSAGPYFGFLMGDEDNIKELGLKNFDFGIDAMLTGDYALNPFVSILLGTGFQFGGLNNLGSNFSIENVKTNNWRVFSGVRFGL